MKKYISGLLILTITVFFSLSGENILAEGIGTTELVDPVESVEALPAEEQAVEVQQEEVQPVEVQPEEVQPAEAQPVEEPVETKIEEAIFIETNESDEVYVPNDIQNLRTTALNPTKVKIAWQDEGREGYKYKVYVQGKKKKYTLLGETTDFYYKAPVKKNTNYTFKVVAYYNNQKLSEGKTIAFSNKEFVAIDHQKYTYKEMVSDIKSLKKKYSDYMSYSSIGKTEEGRDIYEIVIGNPDAPNCLLVTSCLHAREYITSAICMKQIEYYLINYNKIIDGVKPGDVFYNCCVRYIVMANPDGVTLAQTKKAKVNWKANARGIDLNRNFTWNFVSVGDPAKGNYNGDAPGSAKETQAIMGLTTSLKNKYGSRLLILNYHAQGQIIFWDYLGEDGDVAYLTSQMTDVAERTTKYRKVISDGEPSNGNYREYVMYDLGIPSITVEVGSGGAPVKVKYYKSTFDKNKYLVLREAQILQ